MTAVTQGKICHFPLFLLLTVVFRNLYGRKLALRSSYQPVAL